MDDTGAGGQPSRAEFEALRRKVEAIDDLRRKIDSMDELAKTSSIASPRRTSIADEGGGLFDSMRDLSPKTTKRLEKATDEIELSSVLRRAAAIAVTRIVRCRARSGPRPIRLARRIRRQRTG